MLPAGSISWIHDSGLGVADVAAVLRQVSSELEAGDCIIDCSHPPLPQQAMDGCLSTAPGAEARIQHTQVPVPASKPFKQGLVKQLPTIISVACAALQRGGRVVLCDRTGDLLVPGLTSVVLAWGFTSQSHITLSVTSIAARTRARASSDSSTYSVCSFQLKQHLSGDTCTGKAHVRSNAFGAGSCLMDTVLPGDVLFQPCMRSKLLT